MFDYNPTVNDMSGQIYAQGMNNAAEMQMQMMGQMGNDIGGAIASIAGQYQERETQKAKGRATKKLLEVVGPSIGMTTDKLKEVFGDLKSDADWAQAGDMIGPVLPALINQQLNQSRMGIQQQGQQLATDRMYTQEQLRREREIMKQPPASNNSFTGGSKLRGLFQ